MRKVVVWGPASDMSSTSRGYYVQAGDGWMKTTVMVIPNCKHLHDLRPQLPQPNWVASEDDEEYFPPSPAEFVPPTGESERMGVAVEEIPAASPPEDLPDETRMPEALLIEHPSIGMRFPAGFMGSSIQIRYMKATRLVCVLYKSAGSGLRM